MGTGQHPISRYQNRGPQRRLQYVLRCKDRRHPRLPPHRPAADGAFVSYPRRALPPPASHRFYFDHGTATLDSLYAPYQERVDAAMRAAGYTEGKNWVTRIFPGADHSERSWRVRVAEPLIFLLGR